MFNVRLFSNFVINNKSSGTCYAGMYHSQYYESSFACSLFALLCPRNTLNVSTNAAIAVQKMQSSQSSCNLSRVKITF
jgi:hypothetical protein